MTWAHGPYGVAQALGAFVVGGVASVPLGSPVASLEGMLLAGFLYFVPRIPEVPAPPCWVFVLSAAVLV